MRYKVFTKGGRRLKTYCLMKEDNLRRLLCDFNAMKFWERLNYECRDKTIVC